MTKPITCGEATIRLLERYGVTTVFGIPGVHTLDLCRGLNDGVRHIQARNEQGAGFMAEGWARATGSPGVAIVISGPGVTNITTAIAQCYADSLPLLVISAEPASDTLGKGWGVLHEVTSQQKLTAPITTLSATVTTPSEIPTLIAQAFSLFHSERPRPVHISIPIDVQAMIVAEEWNPVEPALPKTADQGAIDEAANRLMSAKKPLIIVGGGAQHASAAITKIAEQLGALVIATTAGKGIVPDSHPLSLSATLPRPEVLSILKNFDIILAIGTELSDTESFETPLEFSGDLIRIDIDGDKLNDLYPCALGIAADASDSAKRIAEKLGNHKSSIYDQQTAQAATIKKSIATHLTTSESQHQKFINHLLEAAPKDTCWSGDACQLVYSGCFMIPTEKPRRWFFPAGYCALGNALPNAIGAKLAIPDLPVVTLVGDGGVMFTVQELVTAAELQLPIPIIIWDNSGYKQIQDDMDAASVERVGVEGLNPDFVALAKACHCDGFVCDTLEDFQDVFTQALLANRPTVIVVKENRQ